MINQFRENRVLKKWIFQINHRGEYFGYSADNHRGIVSDFEDAREKFLILKKKIVTKSPKMAKTAIFQACLFIQNSDLGKSFVHHRGQVLNFCQNIHP